MLLRNDVELDTNLGLGTENPSNPIRSFQNGSKFKALGDLFFMSQLCMIVFLTIEFVSHVKLF